MKKTTTPKQLNLCKFLIAAFAFCLQVGDLVAQITIDFTRADPNATADDILEPFIVKEMRFQAGLDVNNPGKGCGHS